MHHDRPAGAGRRILEATVRRARRTGAALAGLVAVALVAAGCGSGSSTGPQAQTTANVGQNQINPVPYDQVPAGGTLTWPLNSTIVQFNANEIDGNDVNFVYVMQA